MNACHPEKTMNPRDQIYNIHFWWKLCSIFEFGDETTEAQISDFEITYIRQKFSLFTFKSVHSYTCLTHIECGKAKYAHAASTAIF